MISIKRNINNIRIKKKYIYIEHPCFYFTSYSFFSTLFITNEWVFIGTQEGNGWPRLIRSNGLKYIGR